MSEITDTRQLIERESELEEEREQLETEQETNPTQGRGQEIEEIVEELGEIEDVRNATSEFTNGATMVEFDDFEGYARQFAEDIGAIEENMRWPCNHINWEKAAEELAQDFVEVTYQETVYLVRG